MDSLYHIFSVKTMSPGKKTVKNPKRAKCNLLSFDERGKLVKIKENGEVKEDKATLTQYAQNYNFRR